MTDRDLRPSRFDLSLEYAREFISEWFDQNPLGQICVVGMRAGLGERLGEMSGAFHLALASWTHALILRYPNTQRGAQACRNGLSPGHCLRLLGGDSQQPHRGLEPWLAHHAVAASRNLLY